MSIHRFAPPRISLLPALVLVTTAGVSSVDPGVIALMIPIVAIVSGTVLKMARLRSGQDRKLNAETDERLHALEQDVMGLRQELSEAQERIDFAERILTERSDSSRQ